MHKLLTTFLIASLLLSACGSDDTNTETEEPTEIVNFDYASWPDGETDLAIQALLPEYHEVAFGIVNHPIATEVIYFASSHYDPNTDRMSVAIHQYNEDTEEFKTWFEDEWKPGQPSNLELNDNVIPYIHVLAYEATSEVDSGHLVLLVQDLDDSPGPCTEPILLGHEEHSYGLRAWARMNFADPGELQNYTLSEERYQEALATQEACLADWE